MKQKEVDVEVKTVLASARLNPLEAPVIDDFDQLIMALKKLNFL